MSRRGGPILAAIYEEKIINKELKARHKVGKQKTREPPSNATRLGANVK